MRVRVQVVIEPDDGGPAAVHEVRELQRGALQIDTLGLQLAEAKELLRQIQEVVIEEQVRSCLAQQVACPQCGRSRRHKDVDSIVVRTLAWGAVLHPLPRYPCESGCSRARHTCSSRPGFSDPQPARGPRT